MINLFSFCDIPWLPWLLPLLGLLLGYLIWGLLVSGLKKTITNLEGEVKGLKNRIKDLEGQLSRTEEKLEECRRKRADLEGELALAKGRASEMEAAMLKANTERDNALKNAKSNDKMGFAATPDKAQDQTLKKAKEPATQAPKQAEVKTDKSTAQGIAATGALGTTGAAPKSGSARANKFAALKADNLQIMEGIGPKMESVCKENGISSWADMASKSPEQLKEMLGKYGDKYRIIDPATWSQQAALARDGKWDELIALQKQLDGGKASGGSESDSKVEKIMIKLGILKKWKTDDLKAVEGIGPKIDGLLQGAGIKSWSALSNTSVDKIKEILAAAGKRYQLADPSSWPKQAGLAAAGKFDELEELQDQLNGGK